MLFFSHVVRVTLWTVCDDHSFKDERLFFRFRRDDGTYEAPPNTALLAKGEQIYSRLAMSLSAWKCVCGHYITCNGDFL